MTITFGPKTEFSDQLHGMKYRSRAEDFREAMNRIAFVLMDGNEHYHLLRELLLNQRFLPAGRIQGAIGATRQTTAFNCFVSGTIDDSLVEGRGSIMQRLLESAATSKLGGGIGYDFSTLRPRGESVKKIESNATGPVSFMKFFDTVGLGIASSGHRRGAQMGVLRVDHPDIEEFVLAKQNSNNLTGFNISVAVTDKFMEAALNDKEFDLEFGGKVYKTVDAAALWERIMRSTWDYAEPGVLFIDRVNEMNNLWYAETIAATNPCGEQPLPPFGACLLGSFNLTKYLRKETRPISFAPTTDPAVLSMRTESVWSFDWDQLIADIPIVVRAMDNVTDRTRYPLAEQKAEALSKRRMGLGVTGLANTAEALGHSYGSEEFLNFESAVLGTIQDNCYIASALLAKEKGPFPLFDADRFLRGKFVGGLSEHVRSMIRANGIRNSHLTSIAPTGTISMCADNISSSIEPVFSYSTQRPINTPDGQKVVTVEDYGSSQLGVRGKLAADVTAEEHIRVLTTAQKYVDSAVSKTVNMDGRTMPWAEFKGLYRTAWESGAKGCTTFNISGLRTALLTAAPEEGTSCEVDAEGRRNCA